MKIVNNIISELKQLADPRKAEHLQRFFKTGKGQYGEGDIFLGIRVPMIRKLVKKYQGISITDTLQLLRSELHEQRLLALLIYVDIFKRVNENDQERIYNIYLSNTAYINNWDLVDSSAEPIVGAYLNDKERTPIYNLANSENLWERRISVLATFHFIKRNDFTDSLNICKNLLNDKEDLIHKASGWMLREIGKRDQVEEEKFLHTYYKKMPRTMLRYAIEKFPESKRKAYLRGDIGSNSSSNTLIASLYDNK